MTDTLRHNLAKLYVVAMVASGCGLLASLVTDPGNYTSGYSLLALLALALAVVLGEVVPVKIGPGQGEVAPSTTFAFALLMTGGVAIAIVAQIIASLIADVVDRKPPSRTAFNAAQYTMSLWLSSLVLGITTHPMFPARFDALDIAVLGLAGAVFFLFNAVAVTTAVALHTGTPLRRVFSSDLTFHAGTETILLGLAPLAVLAVDYSPALLPLLVLPLFAINRAGRHAVVNERLALHDTLTNLPNRVLFLDRASLALSAATRHSAAVTLMMIDLDRFKEINDALGHHVGDEVLCQVADRMIATLRDADTVARLGGDEFAVLLDGELDTPEAVAEKLCSAIAAPMEVRGIPLLVDASIGIASSPRDGETVEALMQRADVAMYNAKTSDAGYERYERERDDNSVARLTTAAALRGAIEARQVEIHFQPQFDTHSGALTGAEALVRWNLNGEPVPPDVFIPIAEQTGLIVALTDHVLATSVRALTEWRAAGLDVTVAVNLSARALIQDDLPGHVAALCREHRLPPGALTLEITETMVASDPRTTIPVIEQLAAAGVAIAIDDFGTGFSSLEYLKRLPVAELKVDRAFVIGMADDPRDRAIVGATVDLGHRLGLRVVAEGVETAAIHTHLAAMGCDAVQGFLLGAAVSASEFARLHIAAARTAQQLRSA